MLPTWLLGLFRRGVSISIPLGSFYNSMSKDEILARLEKASDEAVKDFEPKVDYQGEIVETYCNIGADFICREVWGYKGFMNMMANQIYDRMRGAVDFALVDPEAAQRLANDGRMVIAAQKGDEHGHVAVVIPGTVVYSGKWRCNAPRIANVGKRNGKMAANWAFIQKPEFYAHIPDVQEKA